MITNKTYLLVFAIIGAGMFVSAALADEEIVSGVLYQYDFTTAPDTLTNTDSITFDIPASLHSKWQAGWFFTTTQISGTTDLTCKVYEKGYEASQWEVIDTLDLNGTSSGRIEIASVYGKSQKCDCFSTGSQSTQIDAWAVYKKQ